MDMETIRLIGVGVCTLLAGVLGSGITAFVTARNSSKQRIEDRFIWKREKVLELVTETLEAGRNLDVVAYRAIRNKLYPTTKELWDFKRTMYRLGEHFLIMDSGIVAKQAWQVTMIEIHRLNAIDHEMDGSDLKKSLEDWSIECRQVRTMLLTAMKIDLGDPNTNSKKHRENKKAFQAFPMLVEPEEMTPNFYTRLDETENQKDLG
ncbi:hypothetical protein VUN82_09705 [Micrococcaceae bacterium Sec5.1]